MNDFDTIAQMGAMRLTGADVRQLLEALSPADRDRVKSDPETLRAILRNELWRMILRDRAQTEGFADLPHVQAQVQRAMAHAVAAMFLEQSARPEPGFPTPDLVREYYDRNPQQFTVPAQYRLAQIFLATPMDSTPESVEEVRRRAEGLAMQAREPGADFAALARANSQHVESAARGGELGWTSQLNLLPEIHPTVMALEPDEVSNPVRTTSGYHVIKMYERKPSGKVEFDEVREAIQTALLQRQTELLRRQYLENLFKETPPTVNEIALRELIQSGSPTMAAIPTFQ